MKYIVVTGGAGFIGSNLINSLTAYDKKLKIISNPLVRAIVLLESEKPRKGFILERSMAVGVF